MALVNPGASPAIPNATTLASVSVFSDVRALGAGAFPLVQVLGGTTVGDGQDGWFYWNSTSIAADDGFAVLAPNLGGTGRWIRIYGSIKQSGTTPLYGFATRTLQAKAGETYSVKDFKCSGGAAVAGDGVQDDSTGIQAAINWVSALGGILFFPPGTYLIGTTTLVFKNKVKYLGAGKDSSGSVGTIIRYTGTSDAIQINNPINSSTAANIVMEDFAVVCTVNTSGKASIADIGSSYLQIRRVRVSGNDHGIILDQSELVVIDECDHVVGTGTSGVWLVNGADHTVAASTYYTNVIEIRNSQFNGSSVTANVHGILDDGGGLHHFHDNNFNALDVQIRVAGVRVLSMHDNDHESPRTTCVKYAATRYGGTATEKSSPVKFESNAPYSSAAISLVTFVAASVGQYVGIANDFVNAHASGTPYSGMTAGCDSVIGFGNRQQDVGSALVGNTVNVAPASYAVAWTATANPAIGNGTLSGGYSLNGGHCKVTIAVIAGTTTTAGTGDWSFSLPFTNKSYVGIAGSAIWYDASAGTFQIGTVFCQPNATTLKVGYQGGFYWGATTPIVIANTDEIYITLDFPVIPNLAV